MKALPRVPVTPEFIAFNGGLDTVSPPLSIDPGLLRTCQNFEQDINGGYARVMGYERLDGRVSPSDQTYAVLTCTITGTVNVGDILTDNAGTSYGTVIALPTGSAVLTKKTGTWATPGNLKVGVTVVGSFTDAPVVDGAPTTELHAQYRNLAADAYRSDIQRVGENTVTITNANPGVVTWTAHGFLGGEKVKFSSSGTLPTGMVAGTTYYVLAASIGADTFRFSLSDGGAPVDTTGTQSGTHTCTAASGGTYGVVLYADVVYAFRNTVDAAYAYMWKATTTGWSRVPLYREVSFTAGSGSIAAGQTVTETTGSETATIMAVVITSGTLAAGTAAGRLIVTTPSGSEFEGGAASTSGGGTLTLSGASTAITIGASGSYDFAIHNFSGSGSKKLYIVNGVSRAMEFDGTTIVPISTGMSSDAPTRVVAHKQHLFLSFAASVQHSAPMQPYIWSVIVGAAEIAMGDTVTGFQIQPGGEAESALAIFTRNSTATLYGTGVTDWKLVPLDSETGAIARTNQRIGITMMLDDRGLISLEATDVYGNFASASLSSRIQNWLKDRKSTAVASCVSRNKNQYRLFFSSGAALYVTMNGSKVLGMMPVLLSHGPYCVFSGEMANGDEASFLGSSDGYVFEMEKGTSFDGAAIEFWMSLHFAHQKSPRQKKRYREVMFEVSGTGYSQFYFTYELGYGSSEYSQPGSVAIDASLAPAYWDSFTWDAFVWDGRALLPTYADLAGSAENISFIIRGSSDYHASFRISGALLQYSMRKVLA